MKKTQNKKHQKQAQKTQQKNHGNFTKFINSKTNTHSTQKQTPEQEDNSITNNVSQLKDMRNQPTQFTNYIDNAFKKTKKIKLFDLDSDDEIIHNHKNNNHKNILTHHGKNLADLKNDYEISNSESENEYNEKLQARIMKKTNFGGYDNQDNQADGQQQQKSKAEIYKEIIKKSKKMKYEKQKLREENDAKRQELDSEYKDLIPLLTFKKDAIKNKQQQQKQKKFVDDEYMLLKKSLEQEDVIVRPLKQVKNEQQQLAENALQNQDKESSDSNVSENEDQY